MIVDLVGNGSEWIQLHYMLDTDHHVALNQEMLALFIIEMNRNGEPVNATTRRNVARNNPDEVSAWGGYVWIWGYT